MAQYFARRLIYMFLILVLISMLAFTIIQLPPGDYLSSYIMQLEQTGERVDEATARALRERYGLDKPIYVQYYRWVTRMLRGDFGRSFEWDKPVNELLLERLPWTVLLFILTVTFTYGLAIPIGIYSAVRQYSLGDSFFTLMGFIGLATPNFLLALILMFIFNRYFGTSIGGLMSSQFQGQPWTTTKIVDFLKHMAIPVTVIGMSGTAGLIRVMRASLLDELSKQYVITAQAKGVNDIVLLFKYPVRIALNPIISTVGWILPQIVSGETITAVVLNLPTIGPLLLSALLQQDMYMAGSIVMLQSFLAVIGTFLSDILLVWIDPRIRFERS